jgi:hypothetical protein
LKQLKKEPALDPAKVDPVAVADKAAVVLVTHINRSRPKPKK